MTRDSRTFYALLLFALLLFSLNIGGYDLWPPDEPRYAEVAREMVVSGDYLVPRVNGETYFEKPPLLFWLMALCSAPFGDVNEYAARIPSILCAVYVVGITYALAARLFTRQVALWSALVLITCFRFWYQARRGQIDMLLTAEMMTVLYAFWRWDIERRVKWLWVAYAGIALGLLSKGPPALVFPGLFLIFFYWKNREGRKATRWVWGFLGAIAVVGLWYIPARMLGAESATEAVESGIGANLFRNTIGRALLGVSKAQPPWYYLTTLPVGLLPWTFVCPPVLYWAWKNRRDSLAMRFIWAWVGPALVFFSIIIGKRELYLLPLLPVIAIFFGAGLVHLRQTRNFTWMTRGAAVWSELLLLFAALPLVVDKIPYTLPSLVPVYAFVAVAVLAGVGGLVFIWKRGGYGVPALIAVQAALIFGMSVFTVFPVIDHFKSARTICAPIRTLVDEGKDVKVYSMAFSREEYVYYARQFHEPVFTGLVGDIAPENLLEQARLQKKAQRLIQKAVRDVPLASLVHPSPAEKQALVGAIDAAVEKSDAIEEILHFEDDLRLEVNRFFQGLATPEPAFCFVQEEDWRWLIAFVEGEHPLTLVSEEVVGSRHVLLLANDAALVLLNPSIPESSR